MALFLSLTAGRHILYLVTGFYYVCMYSCMCMYSSEAVREAKPYKEVLMFYYLKARRSVSTIYMQVIIKCVKTLN